MGQLNYDIDPGKKRKKINNLDKTGRVLKQLIIKILQADVITYTCAINMINQREQLFLFGLSRFVLNGSVWILYPRK